MKPNVNQIKIADVLVDIIRSFRSTNDIQSSSHENYIEDELYVQLQMNDIIDADTLEELQAKICEILYIIQKITWKQ